MNKNEKIQFVLDLSRTIQRTALDAIIDDKIPEDWDGVELRWYLAELHKRSASFGNTSRKRKYNNTINTSNL